MENFDKNYEALWEVNRTKELENFDENCKGPPATVSPKPITQTVATIGKHLYFCKAFKHFYLFTLIQDSGIIKTKHIPGRSTRLVFDIIKTITREEQKFACHPKIQASKKEYCSRRKVSGHKRTSGFNFRKLSTN